MPYDLSPPLIDFTPLSRLGATIGEGLEQRAKRRQLADLGSKVQGNDYAAAAKAAFDAGDMTTGMSLAKLAQDRDAVSEQVKIWRGGAGAPAADAPAVPAQAASSPKLPTFAQGDRIGQYAAAIQGNESGGNYQAVGPTHPKYGRALGAYQVMEANLPQWSQDALGRQVSPAEFLASPQIQDAIFQHRFGQYVAQTGSPQDAASMWFTGKPLAQGANLRDVLGTTGQGYVDKFNAGLARSGGAAPPLPQTAMAMPGASQADLPAPGAQEAQFYIPGTSGQPGAATPPAASAAPANGLPPAVAARVDAMLGSKNVEVQKAGLALAQKYATEAPKVTTVAPGHVVFDERTRQPIYTAPEKEEKDPEKSRILNDALENWKKYGLPNPKDEANAGFWRDFSAKTLGGGVNVTNNNTIGGEKAYDQEQGKAYAKLFGDLQDSGRSAPSTIGTLRMMRRLTESPDFYSGAGGEKATQFKKALVAIGVKDADAAAPNELFQKLSNRTILDMSGGSLGNGFSNADRDFIQATTANIGNTPEGNRRILDMAEKVETRKAEIAKRAREYAKGHNGRIDAGFDDELAAWAEKNPAFKDEIAATPGAAKLPSGASGGTLKSGIPWKVIQ